VSGEGTQRQADTKVISSPSIFGGQLFGLAVAAAAQSPDGVFVPVSLQAQLLERGEAGSGIDISVTDLRDGRSTRHRSLTMSQQGRPIASVLMSLAPLSPERAPSLRAEPHLDVTSQPWSDRMSPFISHWGFDEVEVVHREREALHPLWVKPRVDLPDDPVVHAAAIAFVTDMALVMVPYEERRDSDVGTVPLTVDHSIWFHGVPRFDDWVILDAALSTRRGDSALVFATITDIRGDIVATACQGVRLIESGPARPR